MELSEPPLDPLLSTVFVIEMFISMEKSCTYVTMLLIIAILRAISFKVVVKNAFYLKN